MHAFIHKANKNTISTKWKVMKTCTVYIWVRPSTGGRQTFEECIVFLANCSQGSLCVPPTALHEATLLLDLFLCLHMVSLQWQCLE